MDASIRNDGSVVYVDPMDSNGKLMPPVVLMDGCMDTAEKIVGFIKDSKEDLSFGEIMKHALSI